MKVYELIEQLKNMPQFHDIKLDDGQYINDIKEVELDEREYVIIRPKWWCLRHHCFGLTNSIYIINRFSFSKVC